MKTVVAALTLLLASASAFAPTNVGGRPSTAQAALADRIFGLDLFNYGQNDYVSSSSRWFHHLNYNGVEQLNDIKSTIDMLLHSSFLVILGRPQEQES